MELLKLDFEQTMLRFVDVRMMLLLRNRHQTTVELIGPTVIRATNDALARSASLQHSRCAVSANVLECAQLFIFAAHNENVIAANIVRDEIAYSRHFIDMANELPATQEKSIVLELVGHVSEMFGNARAITLHAHE